MLPVLEAEPLLRQRLDSSRRLVLTAPTGSGKTTQVPQILLRQGLRGQILVLQPRRLAARVMARRVAEELRSPLGQVVGYQTRFDSLLCSSTRIRFITEGVFLRLLQEDPLLQEVGAVVLDEFHERSLNADMALGLVRRLQEGPRPDLFLLVMSATLDTAAVCRYLECPMLEVSCRAYPVDIRYLPGPASSPPWDCAAAALSSLMASGEPGDVLVFMPGAYEIRRTLESCRRALRPQAEPVVFLPLYSSLPAGQQDAALAPGPHRKVIVATNVAETSITIEGIRHVIDSGLARTLRHDPRRGIDVLLVEAISQSAAEQRAGRAGRTAPGTCTRLWCLAENQTRPARTTPEILRVDLAEAILHLSALGVAQVMEFPWLDRPEPRAAERACQLLEGLGALDRNQMLTPQGRQMAQLPMHPRQSRMLVEAASRGCLERAVVWAALLGERGILVQPLRSSETRLPEGEEHASDLVLLEHALRCSREHGYDPAACDGLGLHAPACRQVDQAARAYLAACRRAGLSGSGSGRSEDLLKCLLTAYFDRVALRRDGDALNCVMAGQRRVVLDGQSVVRQAHLLVAVEVRELEDAGSARGVRTVLSLASQIDPGWLQEVHPQRVSSLCSVTWNAQSRCVEQVRQVSYDGLVYEQVALPDPDPASAAPLLAARIRQGELVLEQWEHTVEQWLARTRCTRAWFPDKGLIGYEPEELELILLEIVAGATRYSQIKNRPCLPVVQSALSWQDRQFIERMAPARLVLPGGQRLKLEYQPGQPPRGRAHIQELYGLQQTPCVADGRQPVLLEILGPNHRPVQVTDDLAAFWQNTYPELKKELRRRYPRHEWR